LKRILHISLWVLSVAAVVFLLAFTNKQRGAMQYNPAVVVNIQRSQADNRFLDAPTLLAELGNRQIKLQGTKNDINLAGLEDELNNNPYVKKAQVYATVDGRLSMELTERKPIIRVITYDGDSYYIDEDGGLMPLSDRFTAHVPVATGFITEKYSAFYTLGIKGIEANEKLKKSTVLDDLYNMAKHISADSLWSAQIDQLHVLKGNEINLVPKIGNGLILFGTTDDMDNKFAKLRTFYKHAVATNSLNAYQTINLKFNNQVVCTKKL
jgi:cell division protein FtsQ